MPVKVINNGYVEELDATKSITMTDAIINSGRAFTYSTIADMPGESIQYFAFTTGSTYKTVMKNPEMIANVNYVKMQIYEGGTYTEGAELDFINYNRILNYSAEATLHIATVVDVSSSPLIFQFATIGTEVNPAISSGAIVSPNTCFILNPSSTYIIRMENTNSNDSDVFININYLECE